MEAPIIEQPDEIDDVLIPANKPEPVGVPKMTYVTSQYGVKPTASMVAEKPASYVDKAGTYSSVHKPEKKEEPQIDMSGIVEGTTIYHKTFGAGTVANLDKKRKHIRVKFAVGEKTFIFPDAFKNRFLRTEK